MDFGMSANANPAARCGRMPVVHEFFHSGGILLVSRHVDHEIAVVDGILAFVEEHEGAGGGREPMSDSLR